MNGQNQNLCGLFCKLVPMQIFKWIWRSVEKGDIKISHTSLLLCSKWTSNKEKNPVRIVIIEVRLVGPLFPHLFGVDIICIQI